MKTSKIGSLVQKFIRKHLLFCFILLAGLITLVFGLLIFNDVTWAHWYYNRFFIPVNTTMQSVLQFSETPFYMVVLVICFVLLIGQIMSVAGEGWRRGLVSWGLFLLSSLVLIVVLFYWLWGFNYGRSTIGEFYFQDEYVTLDTMDFKDRWKLQTNRVNLLRSKVVMPDSTEKRLTQQYAIRYRETIPKLDGSLGLDKRLQPQCKEFVPAGLLLRLNTAGFYFPFGSESYVDKALHVSQKPFVIAHELAHGYGITDEGEANFIGYLLSQASADPLAQYSSAMALWLYMASDGRHLSPSFTQSMWDGLSPAVWDDLQDRQALNERYPEFMPRMRDAVYDSYLSLNKVEGGMKSYNRFVKMVLTYEENF
ncbi:DUF3810 domain-containing protein [Membranicola marinus]|uniref:DUF3810 domain-containing protein n=1 Tax=Membranihabitans marinus TaxID=1227546 RepID=A0A953L9F0_9BACT|nr:DUF3810 family protein [Membranihabitans marinus]MBY5958785.1 DUF3810 domain-containing protein [Membranihabitans marinus]